MPTVREKMQQECFKISGDMMEISEDIVDKVEDEDFEEVSKQMAQLANRLSWNAQALAGMKLLGEDKLQMDWESFEEESKERQREYNEQMKRILEQMFGLDLDEDEDE